MRWTFVATYCGTILAHVCSDGEMLSVFVRCVIHTDGSK